MQSAPHTGGTRQPVHNREHRLPNLYWRAVHTDTLRAHPRVIALPPVQQVQVCSSQPATSRYVRQHTALWSELHGGLITTGRLRQALGMQEEKAAKALGISKFMRSSHHLQLAWAHVLLSRPRMITMQPNALAHNEVARQAYNSTSTCSQGGAHLSIEQGTTLIAVRKKQHCEAAAMGGNAGVMMAWGMTQEAAALHCLLHIFPQCILEEVGLFQLDAATQLPGSWASTAAQVPAMGASPDGLITHTLQLSAADLADAAALLQNTSSDATAGQSSADAKSRSSSTFAAAKLLLGRGLSRVPVAGASSAAASTVQVHSAGSVENGSSSTNNVGSSSSLASPSVEQTLLGVMQKAMADSSSSSSSSSSMRSPAEPCVSVAVREVVEVKNHCPFRFRNRRNGRKGRLYVNFGLHGRGPAEVVRPEWVPQLQLHMLATGCLSALLVSRSAKGVRVFRVWRDDDYLNTMLTVLANAYAHCTANGRQSPPPDVLLGQPGYGTLLANTVELAAGAECVADVDAGLLPLPEGSDQFAFWPS